ncbi:glycosyltransferase [Halorubrum sp. DTA98]|uniref:glycosyltransferase n=1 Tax=Halorubrum sp. DTA98 TaxID=3402163 RepID=UPI003AAD66FF
MNIVYFLSYFPKLSESFVLNEIYELERNGHNVAVCALENPEDRVVHEEFEELDVPIRYVPRPTYSELTELFSTNAVHFRVLIDMLYYPSLRQHAANLFRAKHCIEFVDSIEWEPDHVHSHFAYASKFPARYAADRYNVPFTITAHAADLYKQPVGGYTSRLLGSADRVITISEYNEAHIRSQFTQDTPIDVVRAGIRPEKFSPTEKTVENRVLTTSRLVEIKGLSYALEAVRIAAEQIPELEYHIIGSGELKPELVRSVDRLGIEDNVTFLNEVSDRRLITELDEARCFLLPCVVGRSGNRDGIPVALMEAMAMKTPPVSTTVSGIPELVDHRRNGILTQPRSPESTAQALVELLRTDSSWAEYATRARRKVVTEFNVADEAEKLESAFREARN